MLRSLHSPNDDHDDHVRQLLDQRTTRAHMHGRFPSLSEFSDSPSVYSRAFFSPRPTEKSDVDPRLQYTSPSPPPHPRSNLNRLNDPAASMLDLDDDPRMSYASSDVYEETTVDDEDDEPMPRMSLLGPKMRFHSRAPWEMEEGLLQEEDESDYGAPVPHGKESSIKKGFVFGAMSPRPSNASRPSGESSRSQGVLKRSFDTTSSQISNPRGALYALAQESLSTSSLGHSSEKKAPRGKLSLPGGRTPNLSLPSSPNSSHSHSNARPPPHSSNAQTTFLDRDNHYSEPSGGSNFDHHPISSYSDDDVHPYANPDLVISYAQDLPPRSPLHSTHNYSGVARNNSTSTVTDSVTSISFSRSGSRSTLTPETSATSVSRDHSRHRVSTIQGREISSPVSLHSATLRPDVHEHWQNKGKVPHAPQPGVGNLPGWTDKGSTPTFALISLEEARAQRSRSATVQHTPPRTSESSTAGPSVVFPGPEHDASSIVSHLDSSPSGNVISRSRARSISAGAKAKSALQSIVGGAPTRVERRDSETGMPQQASNGSIPGRSLKHKKSGFMRLFNGGREKEERPALPPVPPLSDAYAAYNVQHATHAASKITTYRVPVPELSPSLLERSLSQESDLHQDDTIRSSRSSPPRKRTPPPLSINTSKTHGPLGPASTSADPAFQAREVSSSQSIKNRFNHDHAVHSAPPNISEFPALKLRPVSALFSTEFGGHIAPLESRPSLEADVDTGSSITSPNTAFSPITPAIYAHSDRSNDGKRLTVANSEDQIVIRALQEQIISAKMAWQRQIWELEGQVRDLKAEVEDLRAAGSDKDHCDFCGQGKHAFDGDSRHHDDGHEPKGHGVVNRPRARTGNSTRFGSAV